MVMVYCAGDNDRAMADKELSRGALATTAMPLAAALVALILWSGTAIANKIAVVYIDPLSVGVLRSALAGFVATLIAVIVKLPFPRSMADRLLLLVCGISSFAIWPIFLSIGIGQTTASHAALIMAMIPVFVVVIAGLVNRAMPAPSWWLGAVVALTGTVLLIADQSGALDLHQAGASLAGDSIILAGCIICAIGYVAGGRLSPKIGTLATTFWGLTSALIVLLPLLASSATEIAWQDVPVAGWLAVAWLTFLSSITGYALWFYALGHGGISKIGSLQLLMPVITLYAASVVLGESLSAALVMISIVIVGGTFVAHNQTTA
jgi:drug/metabolite transporter (DMT)-like permease